MDDTARESRREAAAAGEELKRGAQEATQAARARASGAFHERQRVAADQIERTAQALRSAAERMRERESTGLASLTEDVAGRIDAASRRIRDEDLDSLVGSATDFARRQPAVFFGAALASGFALSRFLKASASRRRPSAGSTGHALETTGPGAEGIGAEPAPTLPPPTPPIGAGS